MAPFSEEAKDRLRKWSAKYAEQVKQNALTYPYSYTLHFRASPKENLEYEESLAAQKEAPEWCMRYFEHGSWMFDPDLDGTYEFRFKTEEQLALFKLRWHR